MTGAGRIRHIDGPQGVLGRNSDDTHLRKLLGWEPATPLKVGLEETHRWVDQQINS